MYDIADPKTPTKLAHFDTSGPHSRGVHFLWFTDGRYAYLSTGAGDFTPRNKLDDQFLMIVDVSTNFCGEKPEPLLESIKTWRNSCGLAAWDVPEPGCWQ